MKKGLMVVFVAGLIILPLAVFGCKGKVQTEGDMVKTEPTEAVVMTEEVVVSQTPVTEPAPAQMVSQETIPPTAAVPPSQEMGQAAATDKIEHNKQIQTALQAAGLYAGNIDGKIGPKTKRAIVEFQKARGLKADGKVGPKTWAELEKYLKQ
ncbi:MAG: peptidoglycan-binding domain-containing protein [Candidatus Omnitrophota bacterium]|nr:peptidoglycan-binding domain-containing protein [Candidatus Omnitrophota bacterium]